MDWLALNTDGAARGTPGQAGGGGLIRDTMGGFKIAFAASYGICSAYRAEMSAVAQGLNIYSS